MPAWSLAESIADILPSEARKIEDLRRAWSEDAAKPQFHQTVVRSIAIDYLPDQR